jgi:hypothetical protein
MASYTPNSEEKMNIDDQITELFKGRDVLSKEHGIKRNYEIENNTRACFKKLSRRDKLELQIMLPLPKEERHRIIRMYLSEIDNIPQEEKTKLYAELGCDENGNKKGKICWDYIKNSYCAHKQGTLKKGINMNGLWHPDVNERNYLYKKKYTY